MLVLCPLVPSFASFANPSLPINMTGGSTSYYHIQQFSRKPEILRETPKLLFSVFNILRFRTIRCYMDTICPKDYESSTVELAKMLLLHYLACKDYQSPINLRCFQFTKHPLQHATLENGGRKFLKLHDQFLLQSFFVKDEFWDFWKSKVDFFFFFQLDFAWSHKNWNSKRLQKSEISFNDQFLHDWKYQLDHPR